MARHDGLKARSPPIPSQIMPAPKATERKK
jgi:hypothetical protein